VLVRQDLLNQEAVVRQGMQYAWEMATTHNFFKEKPLDKKA
jgi:hypothetical protein